MNLLAIETSTETGAVALLSGATLQAEMRIRRKRVQSRKLVPAIQNMLDDLEWNFRDLNGIAISVGPGSFTGVRIGLSVAKGLAFARDLPVTSVISLDALALPFSGSNRLVCSLIRFRKTDYYAAMFKWDGSRMERVSQYEVLDMSDLNHFLVDGAVLAGDFSEEEIENLKKFVKRDVSLAAPVHRHVSAFSVGLLGLENFRRGRVEDVARLEPFYMKDFPLKKASK